MRPLFRFLPLLALLAAPLQVIGGTTATMQVSFTVLASCTVQAQGATAPAVNCMQADGFIVAHKTASAGSTTDLAAGKISANLSTNNGAGWTVYF